MRFPRKTDEIGALLAMIKKFADEEMKEYVDKNYRIRFMGELHRLPEETQKALENIARAAANNTGIVVNIGINYGGRDEIARAAQKAASAAQPVTVEAISARLDTAGMSDPDVIVRCAGEKRLSNFMLWQCAYAELVFVDDFWPDFNEETIVRILKEYSGRERRFGGLK